MTQHNYELTRTSNATEIQALLASAYGKIIVIDGNPSPDAREKIEILFEILGDISDICEAFTQSDWKKSFISIDNSLKSIMENHWYLYSALIEKGVTNPFNGASDTLEVMILAVSEQDRPSIQLTPDMVDELPSTN
jgi:hypothetical protein